MKHSTYSNVTVKFDNEHNTANAFAHFRVWANKANKKELPYPCDGDFNLDIDFDNDECEIFFRVNSSRPLNCLWQCERCRDWFKDLPGCLRFTADVMMCYDSVQWCRQEEDEAEQLRRDEKHGLYGGVEDVAN